MDVVDELLTGTPAKATPPPDKGGAGIVDEMLGTKPPAPSAPPQQSPGFLESAGNTISNVAHGAYQMVTGEGKSEFPNAPELSSGAAFAEMPKGKGDIVPPQFTKIMQAYAVSVDPQQVADIAVKTLPGAQAHKDSHGNVMVKWKGKDYYVNKPGVSQADFDTLIPQMYFYLGAAKAGGLAKGLLGRMATVGLTSAGVSVGSDIASQELGSEQGISPERAVISGVAGAGFEALSPLAAKAWRFLFGQPKYFDAAARRLTPEGEKAARAAGLDLNQADEVVQKMFAEEAQSATGQGAVGRIRGKEFGIPMTHGQATGDLGQLSKEEATRHGAFGTKGQEILTQFDEAQRTAMQGARGQIQTRLAGGETTLARPQQAGEAVGQGLQGRARHLMGQIDEAYKVAGEVEARIPSGSLRGVTRRLGQRVQDYGLDKELHPAAVKTLRDIARMERAATRAGKSGRVTQVTLRELEKMRRRINNNFGAAKNPADRAALSNIKSEFDNWVDDVFDNALFEGDNRALDLLKRARSMRRQYGQLFEMRDRGDQAGRIIQKILAEDRTPEQVANYVFGRGKLGGMDTSVQVVRRIKQIVGDGSEEMQALREAGWLKLSKEIGTDIFSPTKFKNNLNRVMEENRSLMQELYTPEELGMFNRFRDEVMRTVTPETVRNPSKTSYTLARLMREWTGRLGTMMTFSGNPAAGALLFTAKRVPQVMGTRAAKKAVTPLVPPRLRAPLFTAAGTAGATYSEAQ